MNRGSLFKIQRLSVCRGSEVTCNHFLLQRGKSEGRINFTLTETKDSTSTHPQTLSALFQLFVCEYVCRGRAAVAAGVTLFPFSPRSFFFPASSPRLSSHSLRQTLVSLLQSSYRSSAVQRCGIRMLLDSSPPKTL